VPSVTGISTIAPSASVSQAAGHISQAASQTPSYRDHLRNLLITHLEIDVNLTDRSQIPKLPLQDCYTRYNAVTAAIAKYDQMVADQSLDGTGISADLVDKDIIEVFLGKSLFYEWKKVFKNIPEGHPQMCRWLQRHPKAKADSNVWGITKQPGEIFTRFDLKVWLANGCTLNIKGKNKAVEASDVEMESEDNSKAGKKVKIVSKAESSKAGKNKVKDDLGHKKKDKHRKKDSQR
jgi:hypothetical protein